MSKKQIKRPLREQLLIEPEVQTALLFRAALYGTALAIYFTVIQFFSQQMQHPEVGAGDLMWSFLDEAIYWGPGLMLLGPLFAYDLLKMSNRFAGPVFRLRREMTRLVNNDSKVPISFRDEDFWHDVGDQFNEIRDELMDLRLENAMLKQAAQSKAAEPIAEVQPVASVTEVESVTEADTADETGDEAKVAVAITADESADVVDASEENMQEVESAEDVTEDEDAEAAALQDA